MVLPARLVHPDSKTPTCSLLTHLHKAGADLGLVHPDPVDLAWVTPLRDGSHLVRPFRPTGQVPGTITPSLPARQVARLVLPACSSKGSSSSGRHLVCLRMPCHLRQTTKQHPSAERQTCQEVQAQLPLRCRLILESLDKPRPQRPRLQWPPSRLQRRSRLRLPCSKTRSLEHLRPQASRSPQAPRA